MIRKTTTFLHGPASLLHKPHASGTHLTPHFPTARLTVRPLRHTRTSSNSPQRSCSRSRWPVTPPRMRNPSRIQISISIYPPTPTSPSPIHPVCGHCPHDKADDPHPKPDYVPPCTSRIQTLLSPDPHRPLPRPPTRSRTPW
jgi:hypothetical protein